MEKEIGRRQVTTKKPSMAEWDQLLPRPAGWAGASHLMYHRFSNHRILEYQEYEEYEDFNALHVHFTILTSNGPLEVKSVL